MIINGINYLLLERRGCNYFPNDEIATRSDVGNYRVFVEFTDKNGVKVCGDLGRCYAYDTTEKKPRITSDITLYSDFQFEDERGAWRYNPAVDPKAYTYNIADILDFINAISAEHYDAIKWIETVEFEQERGANFTPACKIHEYANQNRMKTSNQYGTIILHLSTRDYKYLSYQINPLANGKEKLIITLEFA